MTGTSRFVTLAVTTTEVRVFCDTCGTPKAGGVAGTVNTAPVPTARPAPLAATARK